MTYITTKEWRAKHPEKWNEQKRRYYKRFQNAKNKGKRWTKDELDMILFFNFSDRELFHKLGRSIGAIQVKRSKAFKELALEAESSSQEEQLKPLE